MPDESKSELVKRIGERIRRFLSQKQLAERSGLHTNYAGQVERWLGGYTHPALHSLRVTAIPERSA